MSDTKSPEKFIILFLPWLLSVLLKFDPAISYLIAWLGSFFIFYISLTGRVRPLPKDRPIAEQLMRPIFINQIIFAGYMACSSIFYFLNVMGYDNFQKASHFLVDSEKLELTAQCQRYYCLAHAAFVSGILYFMKYPTKQKYYIETEKLANFLLMMALITIPVARALLYIPGFSQFYFQFNSLSFIAGTLALSFAIPQKKVTNTLICVALYLFNFSIAFYSGFKEPIIISILVLGLFLYPHYKKIVTTIFVPLLIILFLFLPAYIGSFRQNAWSGEETAEDASKIALDATLNRNVNDDTNWEFLVYRLSEIDMFTTFVKSTPAKIDFYGLTLLKQSAIAIVPRVFWPSKPSTEDLTMERVYNAGVIYRGSVVSAKPAFVVDAYLSGGTFSIFISLFLYGAIAQMISVKAEHLFGGYILGTALIFSGLFQIFWRGLSFEFIINSVFWSYVSMLLIFKILRSRNILKEV